MTTHINFNSGGIGSWATRQRIKAEPGDAVIDLFTDTLIEDRDLYRFLIESLAEANGVDKPVGLLVKCEEIPDISSEEDVTKRKSLLTEIASQAMAEIPGLVWLSDGRTPWEVFRDVRYLGNSRMAQCSHKLKQEVSEAWIKEEFPNEADVVLYLGIDWTEEHRTAAPTQNWSPYIVKFPMCDEPYLVKTDMIALLESRGIDPPRLYSLGFAHNNCGGFCVRAGHGHFANLYEKLPQYYAYAERKEEEMRRFLGRDVSSMKKERTVDGKRRSFPYTLRQLREDITGDAEIDRLDIGGCGCFVNYDSQSAANTSHPSCSATNE